MLVVGGSRDQDTRDRLATTEIHEDGRCSRGPTLTTARCKVAATMLGDGSVLVAGDGAPPEIIEGGRVRTTEGGG